MKKSKSRSRSYSRDHKRKQFSSRDTSNERGIKLYLSNLGSTVSERKIKEEFENFGVVLNYSLKRKNGKTSNYFGYVVMKSKSDAEKAMHQISKSLGWKITLYDNTESYNHHSRDRSFSRSSSRSASKDNRDSQLNRIKPQVTTATTSVDELHTVKVREIFVKNLPENITQSVLYKTFFIYGEISRIDVNQEKLFAFIRYRLCASASRAYEKAKNMNLGGRVIRVSFSDSGKRKEIIGDENGFELNEKTCRLLHVSLNKNSTVANEQTIREVFMKYGAVKAIHSKSSPGFRPSIYVEFAEPEEAEKAIKDLTSESSAEKRKLLGDSMCDVNFYFKKKIYPVEGNAMPNGGMGMNMVNPSQNVMMAKMNPMYPANMMYPNPMMNQMMYYQMMQRQHMQQQMHQSSMPTMQQMQPMQTMQGQQPLPTVSPQVTQQYKPQPNPINPQPNPVTSQLNSQAQPYLQPPSMTSMPSMTSIPMVNQFSYSYMRPPVMMPYQMPKQSVPPPQPSATISEVKDILQEALKAIKTDNSNASKSESDISSLKGEADLDFEKEYSLEEENLKNIWSGFLTKNKRDRIMVDAYQIRGNISEHLSQCALNVSHRTQYDEIMKRTILGILAISPQNVTQCDLFLDYINYFNEKQRVGVINIGSKYTLYLVPPCEFSRKFYQNPKKHLLGILVDSSKEPKSYVDMNNLSLPPSVISSTEKKLLAKQQKKATQSANAISASSGGGNSLNLSELGFDQTLLNQLKELESSKLTVKERTDLINNNPKLKALLTSFSNQANSQQDE